MKNRGPQIRFDVGKNPTASRNRALLLSKEAISLKKKNGVVVFTSAPQDLFGVFKVPNTPNAISVDTIVRHVFYAEDVNEVTRVLNAFRDLPHPAGSWRPVNGHLSNVATVCVSSFLRLFYMKSMHDHMPQTNVSL